jgi:hypothetical protein
MIWNGIGLKPANSIDGISISRMVKSINLCMLKAFKKEHNVESAVQRDIELSVNSNQLDLTEMLLLSMCLIHVEAIKMLTQLQQYDCQCSGNKYNDKISRR